MYNSWHGVSVIMSTINKGHIIKSRNESKTKRDTATPDQYHLTYIFFNQHALCFLMRQDTTIHNVKCDNTTPNALPWPHCRSVPTFNMLWNETMVSTIHKETRKYLSNWFTLTLILINDDCYYQSSEIFIHCEEKGFQDLGSWMKSEESQAVSFQWYHAWSAIHC